MQTQIIEDALVANPLLGSLTLRRTDKSSVSFPYAVPSGQNWTDEGGSIPAVAPGDGLLNVVPLKIAGLVNLTNESINDGSFNLTAWLGGQIESLVVRKSAKDLMQGTTVAGVTGVPSGVYSGFTAASGVAATGATLRTNLIQGMAEIIDNGGLPTTAVVSPTAWASQLKIEANGATPYQGTKAFADDLALRLVVSPALTGTQAFVMDNRHCYLVLRNDASIEASADAAGAFEKDSIAVRVTARVQVAFVQDTLYCRRLT